MVKAEAVKKSGGMLNSPIAWVGGKRQLRKQIIPRICEHETYVEVFSGGAWVLFGKEPSKFEVLNDIDGELVNFWRVVKQRPAQFIAELKYLVASREIFQILRTVDTCYLSEVVRAVRFYYLVKDSFSAKSQHYSMGRINYDGIEEVVEGAWRRLNRVSVENLDYKILIRRFDKTQTLFYLDPPYVDCPGCYIHMFREEDHQALAEVLKGVKGRFLLSYNDHSLVRSLYRGFKIRKISGVYTMAKTSNETVTEVLISNY